MINWLSVLFKMERKKPKKTKIDLIRVQKDVRGKKGHTFVSVQAQWISWGLRPSSTTTLTPSFPGLYPGLAQRMSMW